MAMTGNMGPMSAESAYAHSFGNLPSGTRYYDPSLKGGDMRADGGFLQNTYQAGLKAMSVTGMSAGTTDKAIIPVYLDPQIIDTSRKFTPLVEIVPRVSNRGITAEWATLSKGSGFTAAEDASLSESNSTYTRNSVAIKYLYAVGRVTGPTLAATPSFMLAGISSSGATPADGGFGSSPAPNALQLEVLDKTREIKELEENLIINGNKTTSGISGDANGTEFDGIIALQSTTNMTNKSSTAISLDDIDTAIANAFDDGGRPNLAVCGSTLFNNIKALVQARIGYLTSEKQVFWGFTSLVLRTMVGEIPVIPSMFMANTANAKRIYFLDLSVVEMRVLQDLTYEKLAKTNDSDKFMLKIYEALIIKNTSFNSGIYGIA
jgi:hypothetical protein